MAAKEINMICGSLLWLMLEFTRMLPNSHNSDIVGAVESTQQSSDAPRPRIRLPNAEKRLPKHFVHMRNVSEEP